MITLRVVFVMIVLSALLVCRTVSNATVIPAHAATVHPAASPAVSDTADEPDATPAPPPQVDVYGNEVDDAVGDYRIDPHGDEYEEHSPETEISRLSSPIS